MKKVLIFVTAMVLLAGVLAGCGGSQNELDFKSVRDTETGEIITIGDTREKIEEMFGEGVEEIPGRIAYLNFQISVSYNNDRAWSITVDSVESGGNRFEFKNLNFDMNVEEVSERFEKQISDSPYVITFEEYYDNEGNVIQDDALALYEATIYMYNENSILRPGEIVGISISKS